MRAPTEQPANGGPVAAAKRPQRPAPNGTAWLRQFHKARRQASAPDKLIARLDRLLANVEARAEKY